MTTIHVPASTANLGPAFDCLGLALDLWNETTLEITGDRLSIEVEGEGANRIPLDETNLVYRAFRRFCDEVGTPVPQGLRIIGKQRIPFGAGLGSSAAAILTGLLGASALLDQALDKSKVLQLAAELDGHADNVGAALYGGLVLVSERNGRFQAQQLGAAQLFAVAIAPEQVLSTHDSRSALPKQIDFKDAVFNIGRSLHVSEALRNGDIEALAAAMEDKLHQPYRFPLIPGAAEAVSAARQAGAAAALSGAGPTVIAFVEEGREKAIAEAMRAPFAERGVKTQLYLLTSTSRGAQVSA
jgi:homoserine kinase